jgi:RNA polymerase sigma-70 factor, ECF subfamily
LNEVRTKTGLSERQLFEAVHARMRSLAGPSASDLDDLVQLAAEQVFRSLGRFDGRSELGTWLYGVCYRVLLNQRRWNRRWSIRFALVELEDDAVDLAPTPPELLEARRRSRQLHRGLARMTEKYRAVVVLHDLEELSVREIATIVTCSELTVRSRLRDGRKQLSRLLQAERGDQPIGGDHELTSI